MCPHVKLITAGRHADAQETAIAWDKGELDFSAAPEPIAQLAEQLIPNQPVGGSIPPWLALNRVDSSDGRAPVLQAGCRAFDSRSIHDRAEVAQRVEALDSESSQCGFESLPRYRLVLTTAGFRWAVPGPAEHEALYTGATMRTLLAFAVFVSLALTACGKEPPTIPAPPPKPEPPLSLFQPDAGTSDL